MKPAATGAEDKSKENSSHGFISLPPPLFFWGSGSSPRTEWGSFLISVRQYMIISRIVEEKEKIALLIYLLGEEGFRRASSICNQYSSSVSASFDELTKELDLVFTPKKATRVERIQFVQIQQRIGENIDAFVNFVKSKAVECKFTNVEEAVVDQVIKGVRDKEIQQKLLMEEGTLTISRALNIAKAIEIAKETSQAMRNSENSVNTLNERKCYVCGKRGHIARFCKNANQQPERKCFTCGRPGHISRFCRNANKKHLAKPETSDREKQAEIPKRDTPKRSFASNSKTVYAMRKGLDDRYYVSLDICGKSIKFLVDTGANVSLLNQDDFCRLGMNSVSTVQDESLMGYSGEPILAMGSVMLTIDELDEEVKFYVSSKGPSLIGASVAMKLGLVTGVVAKVELPAMKFFNHEIRLKEGAQGHQTKPRNIPFSLRNLVKLELDQLEENGVISRIETSEFLSPLVVALKSNGKLRLCIDLRRVNQNIVLNNLPMPRTEEIVLVFSNATVFFKIDLKSAYHQVELTENCRHITGFTTMFGNYVYNRLPFGLATAPGFFQQVMNEVLDGVKNVKCYLDDILGYGKDVNELNEVRDLVLQRLEKYGITINMEKSIKEVKEVEFLGHVISADGVRVSPTHVDKIHALREPKNWEEFRSLTGSFAYVHRFIPNIANLMGKLRDECGSNRNFKWTAKASEILDEIKVKLTKAAETSLKFFVPGEGKISIISDASAHSIAAVLLQDGKPVAYHSRVLSSRERNFSVGEKEALAVIEATERWHDFVFNTPFEIVTDHKALVVLFTKSFASLQTTQRICRWVCRLMRYNFVMKFVPSEDNAADVLSRLTKEELEESLGDGEMIVATVDIVEDEMSMVLKNAVTTGNWSNPKLSPYLPVKHRLMKTDDEKILLDTRLVITDKEQRNYLLKIGHEGHPGIGRMKACLRERVYWPKMDEDIESFVKNCKPCEESGKSVKKCVPEVQAREQPDGPWKTLHADFLGPNELLSGYELIVVDSYSKWPEVKLELEGPTTENVVEFLTELFARFGYPEKIITDQGSAFTSRNFESFVKKAKITHEFSPAYYQSANGQAERFVRSLKNALKCTNVHEWLMSYRNTKNNVTGYSPAELLLGRTMRGPIEVYLDLKTRNANIDNANFEKRRLDCEKSIYRAPKTKIPQIGDSVRAQIKNNNEWTQPKRIVDQDRKILSFEDGSSTHLGRVSLPVKERGRSEVFISDEEAAEENDGNDDGDELIVSGEEVEEHGDVAERSDDVDTELTEEFVEDSGRPVRTRRKPEYLKDYSLNCVMLVYYIDISNFWGECCEKWEIDF